MRTPVIVLTALICATLQGEQARLSPRFQTVYIVEMSNALHQHIASRLTSAGVLWVVPEPTSADAVLTYTIDDAFWSWLGKTYAPASRSEEKKPSSPSPVYGAGFRPDPISSDRYRGNIFLVDPRSRMILWSTYQLPKNSSSNELDRTASRITLQLKTALGKK